MTDPTKSLRAQLEAVYTLLTEDTTTLEKYSKIRTMARGIDPRLDTALSRTDLALNQLKAVWDADVIHLTQQVLPMRTAAEKKRKKALVLFISSWKSLKNEVKRVQGYQGNGQPSSAAVAKTALFAKGPFGIVTLLAAGIVGVGVLLRSSLATVSITNVSCPPLSIPRDLPLTIPGIKLPDTPITPESPGLVTIPGLTVAVDGTRGNSLHFSALGMSGSYALSSRVSAVTFDGESLLGAQTTLKLGSRKAHELVVTCQK